MCGTCIMVAGTGASGVRIWLQAHHAGWLTRRSTAVTIALFLAATGVSSVGLSGTSKPAPQAQQQAPQHAANK